MAITALQAMVLILVPALHLSCRSKTTETSLSHGAARGGGRPTSIEDENQTAGVVTEAAPPELPHSNDPSTKPSSPYGRYPLCIEFLLRSGSNSFDGRFQISSVEMVEGSLSRRGDDKQRACTYTGTQETLSAQCDPGMLQIEAPLLSTALSFAHQSDFLAKGLTGPLVSPTNARQTDGSDWYEGKVDVPAQPSGMREMDLVFSQDPETLLMKEVRVSYGGRYSFQLIMQRQRFTSCEAP